MSIDALSYPVTIQPGKTGELKSPGEQVICYESTGEAEISLDGGVSWVPFMRGIEINHRHAKLIFRNTSAAAITLTAVQTNTPGAYKDRRELAAQIALNGDVQVINSPYVDEGGRVKKNSTSNYTVAHDQTAGAFDQDIITAAQNVNGVLLRGAAVHMTAGPTTSFGQLYIRGGVANRPFIWTGPGAFQMYQDHWFAPGLRLNLNIPQGYIGLVMIDYDIQ